MEEAGVYYDEKFKNYDETFSILYFRVFDVVTWKCARTCLFTNACTNRMLHVVSLQSNITSGLTNKVAESTPKDSRVCFSSWFNAITDYI
jgi:hypothetical protein